MKPHRVLRLITRFAIALAVLFVGLRTAAAPGDLDQTFGPGGKVTTDIGSGYDYGNSMAVQPDGRIVVAGYANDEDAVKIALVRYHADGSLDTSFNGTGKVTTVLGTGALGYSVAVQADGKILVVGAAYIGPGYDFAIVRYNVDGSLDTSFSGTGKVTTAIGSRDDYGYSVAVQADGKIVVAGATYNGGGSSGFAVVRYNGDGSLDTSFNGTGKVTTAIGSGYDFGSSVAVQADGKIVVAGQSRNVILADFAVVRYNADGSLDTSFSGTGKMTTDIGGGDDYGYSVAVQADGKIVVAGATITDLGQGFAAVRYNVDGSLDTSFNGSGKVIADFAGGQSEGRSVTLQADGKIVVAGTARHPTYGSGFALVRYNVNGSLDMSFNATGMVLTVAGLYGRGKSVAVQADGKIVLAGDSLQGFELVRFASGRVPVITSQPQPQTVLVGTGVAFSVTTTGEAPFSYQWQKDGTDLAGATGATLALSNVQTNQAGGYTVVITNAWGSVTSSVAAVTVNRLVQTITFAALPAKRVDDAPFALSATASSGLSVSYSSSDPAVATVSGSTVTLTGVGSTTLTATQAGDATYLPASASQSLAVGIPPGVSSQPVGLVINVTSNAAFSVTGTGTAPLVYQWQKNGVNLVGESGATLGLVNVQTSQAGSYTVVITNAYGSVTSSVAALTVNRLVQTITFAALPAKRVDDGPFSLTATASSGLPVVYSSSVPSVATVSGNTVTITGIGSTAITASQAGDAIYLPTSVNRTLAVAGIPPSIAGQPAGQTVNVGGIAAFNVTAAGTAPLIYQWRQDGVDLVGSTGATLGLVNVQTNQAGNYSVVITNTWGSITSSVAALTVNRLAQTITFGALPLKRVDDAPYALIATASSGLSVSYSSSDPAVATVSGSTVTLTGVGSTTLTATQAGDATYLPASASQSLAVGIPPGVSSQPVGLVINVTSNAAFSVTGTGTAPLVYQWQKNGVNLVGESGATLGLVNVQTSQAGSYTVVITNAYGSVTSSVAALTVNRLVQTITFTALPGKRVDDGPFSLATTVSSGLPVVYSSSVPSVATVSGNTVTITGIGSTAITASQAGDATYLPASVNRTLAVAGIPPSIAGQPAGQTVNVGGIAAFNVTAAGTAPLIYQWRQDGVDLVGSTGATLGLVNTQTNQAGNYSVVITNTWGSITSSVAALTVNRLAQTITFGALPLKRVDDAPFALIATASSGLPVVYSSSVPSVATVSGSIITLTGVGSTVITTSQLGDATYLPAGSVSQTLVVSAPPSITTSPVGQAFTLGSGLTLSVNAGGTGPLFYQWQFNGTNLAGATGATLTLTNLTPANAGAYRVVIANAVGTATTVPVDLYFYGDLKFMATTVLAGTVGQQFRVDYADVLVPGTTNWQVLTNITLPHSPFVVVDYSSAGQTRRFYRAVPVP